MHRTATSRGNRFTGTNGSSRQHRTAKAPPAQLAPISPGEILLEEFLRPMGVSQNALARAIDVPPARINDIVHTRRAITADTAVRFGIYFGTSIEFWINLQAHYDARVVRSNHEPELRKRIKPFSAA